jgi:hypothetical protein
MPNWYSRGWGVGLETDKHALVSKSKSWDARWSLSKECRDPWRLLIGQPHFLLGAGADTRQWNCALEPPSGPRCRCSLPATNFYEPQGKGELW